MTASGAVVLGNDGKRGIGCVVVTQKIRALGSGTDFTWHLRSPVSLVVCACTCGAKVRVWRATHWVLQDRQRTPTKAHEV